MLKLIPIACILFCSTLAMSQPLVSFEPVTTANAITDITGAGDGSGRLFITEKRGTISILENGEILDDLFLDIQSLVINSGERGLLGTAFHPSFPDSPYVYVNYVRSDATRTNRIARFTVNPGNPNDLDESTRLDIIDVPTTVDDNHKAGDLVFGPDGYLYFGTGDGGGGGDPQNNGQNIEVLLGKILRIDVDNPDVGLNYGIPVDNPFAGATPGRDEIWMYGIRNPWRISFDRATGDFWIADVGQNVWEEVNMIPAGEGAGYNMGWDCREAAHNFGSPPLYCNGQTFVDPIFEYPHDCNNPCPYGTGQSITGGFVYRGNNPTNSSFLGHYMAIDYVSERVFIIKQNSSSSFAFYGHSATGINGITTFGEDDNGEIYAGSLSGNLFLLSFSGTLPVNWEKLNVVPEGNGNRIQWTLHDENEEVSYFEIHRSSSSDFFQFDRVSAVPPKNDVISYSYFDAYYSPAGAYYRVAAHLKDGSIEYSPTGRIMPDKVARPDVFYDLSSGTWKLHIPEYWQNSEMTLYDVEGKIVQQKQLPESQLMDIIPPDVSGVYFVLIRGEAGTWSDKLVR